MLKHLNPICQLYLVHSQVWPFFITIIYVELNCWCHASCSLRGNLNCLYACCVYEQHTIYVKIMKDVNENKCGVFFLYGYERTEKTFMWRTLANSLRSKHQIVLIVAFDGIASLLLSDGRTAHPKFKAQVPMLVTLLVKLSIMMTMQTR